MAQQEVSHWLNIAITLVSKVDLSETTINLLNKPHLDPGNADGNAQYHPIIIGGTRIGTSSDREMILPEAGSIRLDNSIGSFGVDRKFSDILERYEIIDQEIYLIYGTSEIEGLKAETNSGYFYGKVLDWSHAIDQNQPVIDIRFDSKKIPKRVINRKLESSTFSDIPFQSIGKFLPVVFGSSQQVKPIRYTPDSSTRNPYFAYATTLSNEHPVGGVATYYAKNSEGFYKQIQSAVATGTAVFSESATSSSISATALGELAYKFKLATETTRNYIITHVTVKFDGNGVAAVHDGTITVRIYSNADSIVSGASTPKPGDLLATGIVSAADYDTSFDAAPDFDITFALDRFVVLAADKGYWISVDHKANAGAGSVFARVALTGSTPAWSKVGGKDWVQGSNALLDFQAFGVVFTDSPGGAYNDSMGRGIAYFNADEQSTVTYPDLTKLDLIVSVNGLKDDSGGTITGTPSTQIDNVYHAIQLMSQTWNGSVWALDSTNWDFTTFSDTYKNTNIAGATDGEFTFEQWLRQVCRNTATKIVLLNTGKIAPYSWGTTRTSQATFTQENSKATRIEKLDSSYIVNEATIAYDRQLIYFDSLLLASQGIPSDYTANLKINKDTSAEYSALIGSSEYLYGKRELAEIFFNWTNTSAAAIRIARYYLTNFNTPPIYAEMEAPFQEFSTLKPLDVVTIINPSLPNYYGGIPSAKLPHYLGEEVDPLDGYNLCEAQTYRAQIEGRTITFNEDAAPTLSLICRLLTNYPNDPT